MVIMEPRLYIEDPHFKMSRMFLSDKTYREAIESFVIVDADVLFDQIEEAGGDWKRVRESYKQLKDSLQTESDSD